MKANDLSMLLRRVASLLDLYDGKDLRYVVEDLHKLKSNSGQATRRQKSSRPESLSDEREKIQELAQWANTASLPDVEKLLISDELFADVENVRVFARVVGVQIGARQSRDACVQTVISHLDRARLHRVISARHQSNQDVAATDSATAEVQESKSVADTKSSDLQSPSSKN